MTAERLGFVVVVALLAVVVAPSPRADAAADLPYVSAETRCAARDGSLYAYSEWKVWVPEGSEAAITDWTIGSPKHDAIEHEELVGAAKHVFDQTLTIEVTTGATVNSYVIDATTYVDCTQMPTGWPSRRGTRQLSAIATYCLPDRPGAGYPPYRTVAISYYPEDGEVTDLDLAGSGGYVTYGLFFGGGFLIWDTQSSAATLTKEGVFTANVDLDAGGSTSVVFDIAVTIRCGGERYIPFGPGSPGRFLDDDGSVFEADVEKLAASGITAGCNPPINDRFCLNEPVTRGQMAAFLRRGLEGTLIPGPAVAFTDISGSVFASDIAWLGSVGVTRGCNPPTNDEFCPNDEVTRGQMAAFLVRAFGYTAGAGSDRFVDDDGSAFETDIERLAEAAVTRGCNPPTNDRFCPGASVTRGQMAAFLVRALEL